MREKVYTLQFITQALTGPVEKSIHMQLFVPGAMIREKA